jgi:copper transport protein
VTARRAVLALLILLGIVGLGAMPASAHAALLASNPADNAVVPTPPTAVTLQFSEGVTVQSDGVRVLDDQGNRVDTGTATSSGQEATSPLKGKLAQGSYVVAWRVVSADGHPVRGAFGFSIGHRSDVAGNLAGKAFAGSADRRDEVIGAILRYLTLLGVLGSTGLVLVGSYLLRPGDPSPVGSGVVGFAVMGLVGSLLQVPVQASLATGRGWGSLADQGVLGLALSDGVGLAIALTAIGLVALVITYGLPFHSAPRTVALVGAVLAPLGHAATGHTRTMSPAVVGSLADAAHAFAGAVWFGGLLVVIGVVRTRRADGDDVGAADAVRKFSGLALWSVAVVSVAGGIMAWIEIGGSVHALTSTTYGRLLMVKVGLVVVVVCLAAWNRQRLVPALPHVGDGLRVGDDAPATPAPAPWGQLMGIIGAEVVLICFVLGATAVLTNVTPAKESVRNGPVSLSAPLGAGTMDVVVDPAIAGRNDIHVYIKTKAGRPDPQYKKATFRLELPSKNIGPLERTPKLYSVGHFRLVGTDLTYAGVWNLTVVVQPDRFTETTSTVHFKVR